MPTAIRVMMGGLCCAVLAAVMLPTIPQVEAQTKDGAKKSGAKKEAAKETAKETAKKEKPAKPATTEVKRDRFKIEVKLKGYFAPVESQEVVFRPKVWTTLKLQDVVPHGAEVKKGEVILRLQTEKLEEQLEDARRAARLSEIGVELAKTTFELGKRGKELDREETRRQAEVAQNELAYYSKIGESLAERSARFSLQNSEYQLEYAQEELRQLKKMYEADDLTEETEEIVLKRAERDVASAKFFLELSRIRTERRLTFDMPREKESVVNSARRAAMQLERQSRTAELDDVRTKMQLESTLLAHEKTIKNLHKLEQDLESMQVRAAFDGVVYYGAIQRGRSGDAGSAASRMRPGSSIMSGSVVLTVVATRPLRFQAEASEADLFRLKKGQSCSVKATAFPYVPVEGHLMSIGVIPSKPGAFDAVVAVDSIPDSARLMPGMAGSATVTAYDQANAITVPATALAEENGESFVFVDQGKDKPERRIVRIGQRTKEKIEILDGLSVGDKVLTKKP